MRIIKGGMRNDHIFKGGFDCCCSIHVWGIIESFQMRYGGVMILYRLRRIIAIFLRVFPKFLIVAVLGAVILNAVYYFDFL